MYCVREIAENLYWIGGNDHRTHLFENIHPIPYGVSYNSYILVDKETCVFDAVDWSITRDYLDNIEHCLNGRKLDYFICNHLEPDHCSSMWELFVRYPECKVVATEKALRKRSARRRMPRSPGCPATPRCSKRPRIFSSPSMSRGESER